MTGKGPFDPREDAPLLSAYVDGELEPDDVARIEEHLATDNADSAATRREIEQLRRLKDVTDALRLKEPPPEEWERFWQGIYNRTERSFGWVLLAAGVILLGAWSAVEAVTALLDAPDLPWWVTGAIFAASAGAFVLVVSAVRERIYRRRRTRYKDIVR